jgi:mono/diheme cytochrome c family protein
MMVMLAAAVWTSASCGGEPPDSAEAPQTEAPMAGASEMPMPADTMTAATAVLAEGRTLYEANCMECHGEGARGDGPLAAGLPVRPPSVLEHLAHHAEAELVRIVKTGLPPAMPPSTLSEDEIRKVLAYAWSLVPESELAALRAEQARMESEGAGGHMPSMGPADSASPAPSMGTGGSGTSMPSMGPGN